MNHADIYATLTQLLTSRFSVEPQRLSPHASLEDLGLDSLSLMDFVFSAEDAYNLRIPEALLDPRESGITLERVCEVIASQRAGSDASAMAIA